MPLLWIAPLAIYLLTFILCFDGKGWYRRDTFLAMLAAGLGVMAWTLADSKLTHELALQIGVFCGGLFLACMFCHGELVRLKPAPEYLTRFYLMISLGGALGSALVGIVAPLVLPAYFELAGGLVVAALLLLWQVRQGHIVFGALAVAAVLGTAGCAVWAIVQFYDDTIVATPQLLRRAARAGTRPRQRQSSPVADPRHDPARHAVHGAGIPPAADDLLHDDLGHRPPARGAASEP